MIVTRVWVMNADETQLGACVDGVNWFGIACRKDGGTFVVVQDTTTDQIDAAAWPSNAP